MTAPVVPALGVRTFTVVRVKAAVQTPGPGCLVWVLATDGDGHNHEWQTTDAVTVGDRFAVDVRPLPRPVVGDVAS